MAEHFGAGSPDAYRVTQNHTPHVGSVGGAVRSGLTGFGARLRAHVGEHVSALTSEGNNEHKSGLKKHMISRLDLMARDAQRRSGFIMGTALGIMRDTFRDHIARLGQEQSMFQNTARVHRGDLEGMTHQEIRDVRDHAGKYGGVHAEQITHQATTELMRREGVRQYEKRVIRHGNIAADFRLRSANAEVMHQQKIIHGAQAAAADRRNAALAHQQKQEHMRGTIQNREAITKEARAANRPAKATAPAAAPRAPAQVFHGKKAGTLYTKDVKGNKHYITHKVRPPTSRPRGAVR